MLRCTSDFLGSWINGNLGAKIITQAGLRSSDFLGSWINGNNKLPEGGGETKILLTSSEVELMETLKVCFVFFVRIRLLTSSEVELMETFETKNLPEGKNSSDFLGSWINGNLQAVLESRTIQNASDFLGSWINGNHRVIPSVTVVKTVLLTSSEVELMETFLITARYSW